MNEARNSSSQTYDSARAEEITENIIDTYYDLFRNLEKRLDAERSGNQINLPGH